MIPGVIEVIIVVCLINVLLYNSVFYILHGACLDFSRTSLFAGIQADIAGVKHEYWSSFAPLPVEIVLAAGQRAREEDISSKISFYIVFYFIHFPKYSI